MTGVFLLVSSSGRTTSTATVVAVVMDAMTIFVVPGIVMAIRTDGRGEMARGAL
jgi:hypothetical protein